MSIPFTQYLFPTGQKRQTEIDRPEEIEDLARRFINGGGWYESEVLRDGTVSLTACAIVDKEPQDVAIRLCRNGPDVEAAVDDLVRASITWQSAP